jgi:hypothetical protein
MQQTAIQEGQQEVLHSLRVVLGHHQLTLRTVPSVVTVRICQLCSYRAVNCDPRNITGVGNRVFPVDGSRPASSSVHRKLKLSFTFFARTLPRRTWRAGLVQLLGGCDKRIASQIAAFRL